MTEVFNRKSFEYQPQRVFGIFELDFAVDENRKIYLESETCCATKDSLPRSLRSVTIFAVSKIFISRSFV